jgi:hypothetical protein
MDVFESEVVPVSFGETNDNKNETEKISTKRGYSSPKLRKDKKMLSKTEILEALLLAKKNREKLKAQKLHGSNKSDNTRIEQLSIPIADKHATPPRPPKICTSHRSLPRLDVAKNQQLSNLSRTKTINLPKSEKIRLYANVSY